MISFPQIIDISWPISESMTAYKDQKTVQIVATKTFERDHMRSSLITMSSHSGTHLDSPAHFLADGATADKTDLHALIGPCVVLDLTACVDKITCDDLAKHDIQPNSIILAKTRNSELASDAPFDFNFVALDAGAAEWLVEKKTKAFGIDYLGVERGTPGHPVHTTLLSHGVCIIEGLRLDAVIPGAYTLCCLPLAFVGTDGAPVRAVLLK